MLRLRDELEVAVKISSKEAWTDREMRDAEKDVDNLIQLESPHVLKYITHFWDVRAGQRLWIVSELAKQSLTVPSSMI
jgi:hypothetical protein